MHVPYRCVIAVRLINQLFNQICGAYTCTCLHCPIALNRYLVHCRIMSEQPKAVCGLAYDCVQRLSPIVRQIDFALDWTELEAGKALYRYKQIRSCSESISLVRPMYFSTSEHAPTLHVYMLIC